MIKVATPISTLFENKKAKNKIISCSDCLECREATIESDYKKQNLFHFDRDIVHIWGDEEKSFIENIINSKLLLKVISFHISVACSKPVLKDGIFYCGGDMLTRGQMLDNATNNVGWLRSVMKKKATIAVENNNYYPTLAYEHVTEPDFINEIVKNNDLMLLFDIAHAKITAHNKKVSYGSYIEKLPLTKVVQIHISTYKINNSDIAYDAHELPDYEVFSELRNFLSKFSLQYVTIEYYKDAGKLINVLNECRKICSKRGDKI